MLHRNIYGRTYTTGGATARANEWAKQAEQARRVLLQIESLPVDQAATLIRERAKAQKVAERAIAERAAHVRDSEREPRQASRVLSGAERDVPSP